MKNKILLLSLIMIMFSCNKEDNPEPATPKPQTTNQKSHSDYWGCWKPLNQLVGTYDIILTENSSAPHGFQFGTNCIPEKSMPVLNVGLFRNDTLILNNDVFEYWCFVKNDTLSYGSYIQPPQSPIKFIQ